MIKNRLLLFCFLSLFLSTQALSQSEYNASNSKTKNLETRGPAKGKLLVIGGGAGDFFYEKFMELAGGPDAPIVVIPTALTSDKLSQEDLDRFRSSFVKRGFNNVTVLHTRDRKLANSAAFCEPLKRATGVWFSGGRQWRHARDCRPTDEPHVTIVTKSPDSAGDKHETGRAMLQLEMEKAGQQLKEVQEMKLQLERINLASSTEIVHLGSIVKTNTATYFIAISKGEIKIRELLNKRVILVI